ncbi:RAD51-associated protein 1 [Amia ocellicauda]|uniref:RAD51-associated protein 1 n=1 Tax=Amia ocellicauda TaxID=2972642 RepID=UPI0034645BF3
MARPSRNTKTVDYSQFGDLDDDEDFACVKAPPTKKPRVTSNPEESERRPKTVKASSQESFSQPKPSKERLPLDDKLYQRDLEAALTLSMLQTAEDNGEVFSLNENGGKIQPTIDVEKMDGCRLLSNCSVDINLLGLDKITDEQDSPVCPVRQRQAASKATEQQRRILLDERGSDAEAEPDEAYEPTCTPDMYSGSDADFSNEEEEDEEFTVSKTDRKKAKAKERKTQPPRSKKEKKPSKSRLHATVTPTVGSPRPAASRPSPVPKKPSTPPLTASKPLTAQSPAGVKIPKWTPPGQLGKSPNASKAVSVKSPGQGLRLGLSRFARVKPLHPTAAGN